MYRALLATEATGSALAVLMALASFADHSGVAWPNVRALRRRARVGSLSTVQAAIKELVRLGELTVGRREISTRGGRQKVHCYTLTKVLQQVEHLGRRGVPEPARGVPDSGAQVFQSAGSGSLFLNKSLNVSGNDDLPEREWVEREALLVVRDPKFPTRADQWSELLRRVSSRRGFSGDRNLVNCAFTKAIA